MPKREKQTCAHTRKTNMRSYSKNKHAEAKLIHSNASTSLCTLLSNLSGVECTLAVTGTRGPVKPNESKPYSNPAFGFKLPTKPTKPPTKPTKPPSKPTKPPTKPTKPPTGGP
eukprot:1192874-Prorocentrum_minimum.AAC.2